MKTTTKVLASLGIALAIGAGMGSAVYVKGTIINALTGFQNNGAAPSNHTLCGNGTVYVDAAACGNLPFSTAHDVTASRAWSTIYQNTNGLPMDVDGYGLAVTGSSTSNISCLVGTTSPPTITPYSETFTATVAGGAAGFHVTVPKDDYYECTKVNDIAGSPASWVETY